MFNQDDYNINLHVDWTDPNLHVFDIIYIFQPSFWLPLSDIMVHSKSDRVYQRAKTSRLACGLCSFLWSDSQHKEDKYDGWVGSGQEADAEVISGWLL